MKRSDAHTYIYMDQRRTQFDAPSMIDLRPKDILPTPCEQYSP